MKRVLKIGGKYLTYRSVIPMPRESTADHIVYRLCVFELTIRKSNYGLLIYELSDSPVLVCLRDDAHVDGHLTLQLEKQFKRPVIPERLGVGYLGTNNSTNLIRHFGFTCSNEVTAYLVKLKLGA